MRTHLQGWGRVARRAAIAAATAIGSILLLYFGAVLVEAQAMKDRLGPDLYPISDGARDLTDEYDVLIADERTAALAFAGVQDRLSGVSVVFVPSFLGDQLETAQTLGLAPESQEQSMLMDLGLPVIRPPLDTEAPLDENGRVLADLVATRGDPVCFVSHSKGGLDTLAALLRMDADTRGLVRCWIALQAPLQGTPVADLRDGSAVLRIVSDPLVRALGGSGETLAEMTTQARRRYLAAREDAIRELVAAVPVLTVGTAADGPDMPAFVFAPFHDWMADAGIVNDGMVPSRSALLPHGRFVLIAGKDHLTPFSGPQLQALFALALSGDAQD